MTVFAKRIGQVLVIWGLALLFMMPRLVAGAHWGQDDYIGGVLLALLALGWGTTRRLRRRYRVGCCG